MCTVDFADLNPRAVNIEDEDSTLFRNVGTQHTNHPLKLGPNELWAKGTSYVRHFTPTLCSYHILNRRKLNGAEENELHHTFEGFPLLFSPCTGLTVGWKTEESGFQYANRTAMDPSKPQNITT